MTLISPSRLVAVALMLSTLGGCATARDPRDPWEPANRATFEFNETVDKAILKPVAEGYKFVTPAPIQTWVTNFFSNLNDVVVLANDLLQLKWFQARDDATRLVINSTFGLAGINDIASYVGLEKHDEDLGQTFGKWGLGPGPYFVIPFVGPSTVRDTAGFVGDLYIAPILDLEDTSTRNAMIVLRVVSLRAQLLDTEKVIEEAAIDKYAFIRDAYLQRRINLIYDGNPPRQYEDEGGAAPDKSSAAGTADPAGAPAPAEPAKAKAGPGASLNIFEPREPAALWLHAGQASATGTPKLVRVWLPGGD